jgi:hypothetical protein
VKLEDLHPAFTIAIAITITAIAFDRLCPALALGSGPIRGENVLDASRADRS